MKIDIFKAYLGQIKNTAHRARTQDILHWVLDSFPMLTPRIAWNQPMFIHHGTYIIGFSVSDNHLAVSPERAGILHFEKEIRQSGYETAKMLFRIKWNAPIDYTLLEKMIAYTIKDKADCSTFWRK